MVYRWRLLKSPSAMHRDRLWLHTPLLLHRIPTGFETRHLSQIPKAYVRIEKKISVQVWFKGEPFGIVLTSE